MSAGNKKDHIYSERLSDIAGFTFDESVADVFEDMIRRSVPGYSSTIAMTGVLAGRYAQTDSNCYDLGCSLGAATLIMKRAIDKENCCVIAVDNSEAMVVRCRDNVERVTDRVPVKVVCADINDVSIERASVVILNFTLQFIDPLKRFKLLKKIHDNMLPGAVLILSEKIASDDEDENDLMISMHHDFKKSQGYSELEICQKRTALENILIPETIEAHKGRLNAAGFSSVNVWFQCFNFTSMVAFK